MKTLRLSALLGTLVFIGTGALAQEKVRVSYSSRSYSSLPAYVAHASGFFRDERLDVELIQMRPAISSTALHSGDAPATLTFGSTVGAIVSGFPFKIVTVLAEKPIHHLVARPEIRTVQDLRGKKLGVSQLNGTDEFAAHAILEALGFNPKDVKAIALGDEGIRREALRKGVVDVSAISPPGPVQLAQQGFRILGGPKDVKIGSPSSGLAVTDKTLKEKQDLVRRLIRALLRGLRVIHENPEATKKIMAKWLSQSPQVASDSYDLIVSSFSRDGELDEKTLKAVIEARRRSAKVEKEIPPEQVVDFALVREVRKELGF
ncbi:MAG: ABC transporter substrate-binding protein [Deltaproteobacteria bacterium]|nr:ABC transporter substrate-binding protein [Deltaproteobacteria bacterium]